MKVRLTRAFDFSPDGIHTVSYAVGVEVEGRPAEIALFEKWGERVDPAELPPAPAPEPEAKPEEKPSEQFEEKAVQPPPANKMRRAPKNKAR